MMRIKDKQQSGWKPFLHLAHILLADKTVW
jgi:hypothetical protein